MRNDPILHCNFLTPQQVLSSGILHFENRAFSAFLVLCFMQITVLSCKILRTHFCSNDENETEWKRRKVVLRFSSVYIFSVWSEANLGPFKRTKGSSNLKIAFWREIKYGKFVFLCESSLVKTTFYGSTSLHRVDTADSGTVKIFFPAENNRGNLSVLFFPVFVRSGTPTWFMNWQSFEHWNTLLKSKQEALSKEQSPIFAPYQ